MEEGDNIRFRTSKAEELLAFLIHSEGRPRSKDMILDNLWPDADLDKAANNFRVTCTYIRSTLADLGYIDILVRDHDDYSVNILKINCDYIDFRKKVNNIDALSLEESRATVNLYKVPILKTVSMIGQRTQEAGSRTDMWNFCIIPESLTVRQEEQTPPSAVTRTS